MPPGHPGATCSIIGPGVMDLDAFWAGVPNALDGRPVAVCAPEAIEGLALGTELCDGVAPHTDDKQP